MKCFSLVTLFFDTKEDILAKIGKVKAEIAFIERKIKLFEDENEIELIPTYNQLLKQKKVELELIKAKIEAN